MTPVGAQARYEVRSTDGTMIPVYKSGSGRPVVLVHGLGGDHSSWDNLRPYLESRESVLAVDRRSGFVDPSVFYDLKREFEDVAAVANATEGEVDLLGQSSGAICALGASLLVPKLRRLVLSEPPLVTPLESRLEERKRLLRAGDLEGIADSHLRDGLKLSPEAIAARKAAPDWPDYVARAPFIVREAAVVGGWTLATESFRALRVPVLFLAGGNTPPDHHHRGYIEILRSAGVDVTAIDIPGQEHFALREAPELFAKLVLDFLEAD